MPLKTQMIFDQYASPCTGYIANITCWFLLIFLVVIPPCKPNAFFLFGLVLCSAVSSWYKTLFRKWLMYSGLQLKQCKSVTRKLCVCPEFRFKNIYCMLSQWSATTGPRPGAGPWGVRYRALSSSRLNGLKHFCNDSRNYSRTFYEKERIIVQLLSHKGWFYLRVLIFVVKF